MVVLPANQQRSLFSRRKAPLLLASAALGTVVIYALVVPYIILSGIHDPGSPLLRTRRLGVSVAVNSNDQATLNSDQHRSRQLLIGSTEQRWAQLWNSKVYAELKSFQDIKAVVDQTRYQRLKKDLEPQDTAGLDFAMINTLHIFAQSSSIADAQAWIRKEVTEAVFNAINRLQFPTNCSTARIMTCDLNKGCGFGCQLHHVTHCLTMAVALNRTLVLKVQPWNYAKDPQHGWDYMFEPVTNCSAVPAGAPVITTTEFHEDRQVVAALIIDAGTTPFDPPSIPQDVLDVVGLFHSRPEVWWVSAMMSYLMRPSENSIKRLADFRQHQDWVSPIVGVHVRRTDKIGGEAFLHNVEEYMQHVERHCDLRLESGWQLRAIEAAKKSAAAAAATSAAGNTSGPVNGSSAGDAKAQAVAAAGAGAAAVPRARTSNCSVYLASDEPAVAAEIRQKYKHIHLIVNEPGLKAGAVIQRYSLNGLQGVYDDIIHLSHTDLIVGTFSSQVSRAAYEIAQVNSTYGSPDSAFNYHSVDSMFYYGGQHLYRMCVSHDFTNKGDQEVQAGDELECPIIFEFQDGLERCIHRKTGRWVLIAPATVIRCPDGATNPYRSVLPHYMRRPTQVSVDTLAAADAVGRGTTIGEQQQLVQQQALKKQAKVRKQLQHVLQQQQQQQQQQRRQQQAAQPVNAT